MADALFPHLTNIGTLLLENDTPRAGGFHPLRHVLPQHTVVLGLLTTKSPMLEDASAVEARIQEASQYVPLERLALSPQCGFASVEAGNPLTPDDHAIIGPAPSVEGFFLAVGFCGHGFQHSPMTGRMVAEWIVDGKPSMDLSLFNPARFGRDARLAGDAHKDKPDAE